MVVRLLIISAHAEQLTLDRDVYLGIATSLAEGRGYSTPNSVTATAFRPPLYPLTLAAGLSFLRPSVAVGAVNLAAGLITIWLTLRLGANLDLGWRRFVAGILVAIDPLLVAYTAQPMTEALCTMMASLWLWTITRSWPQETGPRLSHALGCGIAFGLLVLCRPTFWGIAACYGMIWVWNLFRAAAMRSQTVLARSMSGFLCGTAIVVVPWLIRNWIVFGFPILTTTHGGYTLLLGNNPVFSQEVVQQPWGTVWKHDSLLKWQSELESQIEQDLGADSSEVLRDRWHSQQAWRFIKANPRLFGKAVIHRIRSLWNTAPLGDTAEAATGWVAGAVGLFYTFVLSMGCAGLLVTLRRADGHRWVPLYVLIVSVQLAHLLYWTNTRMRAPLTPAIALFAATAIPANRLRNRMTS